ncbi:MAG: TrkH family potassium uptake protein, partial [Planctomycetia bacterium]
MNRPVICRLLGINALLIGIAMIFSLPWAFPIFGQTDKVELRGILGLTGAIAVCVLVGVVLLHLGRKGRGQQVFRREAIAVVGLSWIMATLLGAIPFWLSDTHCAKAEDGQLMRMGVVDGIFESASGFSGTGATVLTSLDDPDMVPRAILFWRSETHFLGGLGIMVLFVAVLGLGSAGKTLMVTEMPGPSTESTHARSQRAAWVFASIFIGLTVILSIILALEGMSIFDALCHAFGAIATGGFSTHDKSIEYFHSPVIEMTLALFMALACVNFTLLFYLLLRKPGKLFADVEFRVYIFIMLVVAFLVMGFGLYYGDFKDFVSADRYGLFQVVSIMTNTGFGTADFDQWNSFSRGLLVLLMFIGGCAGSTSCSVKVIRYVLLFKILHLEFEQIFRPNVVRHVRLGGKVLPDMGLRKDVLVYFAVISILFVIAWIGLVAFEPDSTWTNAGLESQDKLTDCASAVAATLNGVGPGLGIVGESKNYFLFHWPGKL